jgi:hypothetical protein
MQGWARLKEQKLQLLLTPGTGRVPQGCPVLSLIIQLGVKPLEEEPLVEVTRLDCYDYRINPNQPHDLHSKSIFMDALPRHMLFSRKRMKQTFDAS